MEDDSTKEKEDTSTEIEELQQANQARWDRLKELHEQLVLSQQQQRRPSPRAARDAFLQAERTLLYQHPAYIQKRDTLLSELDGTTSIQAAELRFATHLLESCQRHSELERAYQHYIQSSHRQLEHLEQATDEQRKIQTRLLELERQINKRNNEDLDEEATSQKEVARLEDDLKYVASRVDASLTGTPETQYSTLDTLLLQLLEKRLSQPENPYLDTTDDDLRIDPRHVDHLKTNWIVQAFEHDERFIKLTSIGEEEDE